MNTTGKIIVGIIVALVVIGGGAYYWYSSTHKSAVTSTTATSTTVDQSATTQTPAANPNALPSGADTSDVALTQDTAAIDAQMSGLSSDNTAASQSVNDQPVLQ